MTSFAVGTGDLSHRAHQSWSLSEDIIPVFLPRAIFTIFAALLLAVLGQWLDYAPIGITTLAPILFLWIAAAVILSFHGHVGRMLFWLLLMDASLLLYQASVYSMVSIEEHTFLRLGPVLLAAGLLVLCSGGRSRQSPILYVAWIGCNIPALLSAGFQGYLGWESALIFFGINVFYPLVFYFAIGCMQEASLPLKALGESISVSTLVLCLIPLLLIPVELSFRGSDTLASLQFGGRAYSVIGLVMLIWPVLIATIIRWPLSTRLLAVSLVFLTFAVSFSRGALATLALLLLGSFLTGAGVRAKILGSFAAVVIIVLAVAALIFRQWFDDIGWFWLLRLNIASNDVSGIAVDSQSVLDTDRGRIWLMAFDFFSQRPLWGSGIGATPLLISRFTSGLEGYSGMHNQVLTVLVERGLAGFCGFLLVLGRVVYLLIMSRTLSLPRLYLFFSFGLFLLFSNTTGIELFINSPQSMNASVSVYLFILIGFLEYKRQKPAPS